MGRKWLTVPQLQDKMLAMIEWLRRPKMAAPVPVCLLGRQSPGDVDENGERPYLKLFAHADRRPVLPAQPCIARV